MTCALSSSSLGDLCLARGDDEGLQPLAKLLVLDADYRRLHHGLVVGEQVLDLAREDVLAAGDDHLVVAAVDEKAPCGVQMADVAAAEEAVDDLLAAASRVALEGHLVADEDPPDLARAGPACRPLVEADDASPRGGRPAVAGAARRSSGVATVA